MSGALMAAAEENKVYVAIGVLQSEVENLRDDFKELKESTVEEHRKVHDIVVATSEAVRNLTRIVDEMKPLTEDYREKRAEKRGEEKYKNWLYGMAASIGGLIMLVLSKLWDLIASRPHLPILAIIAAMFWLSSALAQEHHHPDQTIYGATGKFYETWMQPDMPGASCCNRSDCDVAVDVKKIGGQWWARKRSGGPMTPIPPEKIEQNRDSPDGQSHLCAVGATVLCFLPAGGT